MEAYSVTGITGYLRSLLESDDLLSDVWVRGEISNLKRASSGYTYFTLKDSTAQLRCAIFKKLWNVAELADGQAIQAHGKISVYDARGDYQLYVDELQTISAKGDLYLQFEQLKQKLESEGLFDNERKRPLPAFPLRLGVVTSVDAAAFQDVRNVLSRRFPLIQIILSPTLVQGQEAPNQIVKAIEKLNTYGQVDVILVCRGGGSIEDLWSFNDERVARAIFNSALPIISGVGHETDFTIADFVADVRAPTPSAAAEMLTPDVADLQADLSAMVQTLDDEIRYLLNTWRDDLQSQNNTLALFSPQRAINDKRQRIDDLTERLQYHAQRRLALAKERLSSRTHALETANPQALLKRGYAMVTRTRDGKPLLNIKDAPVGTALKIRLQDGQLSARVEDDTTNESYNRTLF
jgi:exodeoxyribonuclease VII large subunit